MNQKELAQRLRIWRPAVKRLLNTGVMKYTKVGRELIVTEQEFQKFLDSHTEKIIN